MIVVLGLVGYILHSHLSAKEDDQEEFEVQKVETGDITSRLTETGSTYLEGTVEVMSKVSGTITGTMVEEGDAVAKGQILAVVEPDNTELLRLYGRRAQVATAYIAMVQAKDDLRHQKKLFDEVRGTSRDTVLRNERNLSTAHTNFRLALMELHILEKDMRITNGMAVRVMAALKSGSEDRVRETIDKSLDISSSDGEGFVELADVRVSAPNDGIIIAKGVEVGEMVISGTSALSRGTVLYRIGNLDYLFISCRVSEVDAADLKMNQATKVTFEAFPDKELAGKIIWISPIGSTADGSSIISFPVKIKLDEVAEFVRPGMSCDIDIITSEKKGVIRIPLESVAVHTGEKDEAKEDENGGSSTASSDAESEAEDNTADEPSKGEYVYVKKGEEFEKRPIEIGKDDDRYCEVISGLELGEEIVTNIDDYEEAQRKKKAEKGGSGDEDSRRGRRRIRAR